LSAELRFTAERLLRYERIRTDRPGMNFLVNKVVKLEHIHHAHCHILRENITSHTVIKGEPIVFR
jgi:hypothetical protein